MTGWAGKFYLPRNMQNVTHFWCVQHVSWVILLKYKSWSSHLLPVLTHNLLRYVYCPIKLIIVHFSNICKITKPFFTFSLSQQHMHTKVEQGCCASKIGKHVMPLINTTICVQRYPLRHVSMKITCITS